MYRRGRGLRRKGGRTRCRGHCHEVERLLLNCTAACRSGCRPCPPWPIAETLGALHRRVPSVPLLTEVIPTLFNEHFIGAIFIQGDTKGRDISINVQFTQIPDFFQRALKVCLEKLVICQMPIMPSTLLNGSPSSPCNSGLHPVPKATMMPNERLREIWNVVFMRFRVSCIHQIH